MKKDKLEGPGLRLQWGSGGFQLCPRSKGEGLAWGLPPGPREAVQSTSPVLLSSGGLLLCQDSHRMLTLGSNMEDHLAHPSPDAHDRIQHLHRGCARSYYLILIESARAPLDCWWAKSKWNVHSCFSTISCDNINGPWRRCSGFDLMKTVSQGTFPPPGEERLRQVPQPLLDMT